MAGIMECNELFHHKADNGYEDNIEPIKEIDMEDKKYTAEEALNLQAAAYQKGFNEGYELCKKGGNLYAPLREAIEDILLKTGKHNQEECSELADAILGDLPKAPLQGAVWVKASCPDIKNGEYVAKYKAPGIKLKHDFVGMAFIDDQYVHFVCPCHYDLKWIKGHEELQYITILDESQSKEGEKEFKPCQ
jgi:hypothetical protein